MVLERNGRGEEEEEEEGEGGMMEWEKQEQQQQQQQQQQQEQQQNGGALYVKVMTDEQIELLRRQISVYATICEELVKMHKTITAQQDLSGMRLGNLYCDPLMTSSGHKITSRQRWTPTPAQLQILEHIFDQGNGTPSKQKIKEITNELTQHGQISETNVYNWFQNRRARSKRKQVGTGPNNGESEVETEVESPNEKKTKSENAHSTLRSDEVCLRSSGLGSELHYMNPQPNKAEPVFPTDSGSKSSGSLGHMSFYDTVLSNPRIDQLMGKMEVPGSYNIYQHGESYDMI